MVVVTCKHLIGCTWLRCVRESVVNVNCQDLLQAYFAQLFLF